MADRRFSQFESEPISTIKKDRKTMDAIRVTPWETLNDESSHTIYRCS